MKLPYYNCVTGETEIRESPADSDEVARQFIPQDEWCQAEYTRLRQQYNIPDAYHYACLYAVEHHGFSGDKDSPHQNSRDVWNVELVRELFLKDKGK